MNDQSMILSASGIKNLVLKNDEDEQFKFCFGRYSLSLNKIYAQFLSPLVSRQLASDPTINSINFNQYLKNITISEEVLHQVSLISQGYPIDIKDEHLVQMQIISILVENKELFSLIDNKYKNKINKKNICQYLDILKFLYQNSSSNDFVQMYSNIIKYISSHFYSIDTNILLNLPLKIIHSIISNDNLIIENEDSLFEFIHKISNETDRNFQNDDEINIINFYEEIEFMNLSEAKFNEFLSTFSGKEMTEQLWDQLRKRFYSSKNYTETIKLRHSTYIRIFEYDGNISHSLEGIIHYFTEKSGGNVSEKETVKVTSSPIYDNRYYAKYSVDLKDPDHFYHSNSDLYPWLQYDFIQNKVLPTHYSIRTRQDNNCNQLRSWVIEGSNTACENDWIILDRHDNDTTINGQRDPYVFHIDKSNLPEEGFQYLRIRKTGVDSSGKYFLTLSALEYFGVLFEKLKVTDNVT